MSVAVQSEEFDPAACHHDFALSVPSAAVVTFTGYVRDFSDQFTGVSALELECYPSMAEKILSDLGAAATKRFGLRGWRIIHRYGKLEPTAPIVWCAVGADHRTEAFEACQFMMDVLKTDAPFWKREHSGDSASWVEAKFADQERRDSWRQVMKESEL